jgi:hypothetical protein
MEKIIKIEEVSFDTGRYSQYDGYAVITDKQVIKIGISNGQSCCENWGYFMSEDNLKEFIGADLIEVSIVDTALNTEKLKEEVYGDEYANCMFVNFNTSKGLLQFVAYNEHNGYYGHDAVIISDALNHSETL